MNFSILFLTFMCFGLGSSSLSEKEKFKKKIDEFMNISSPMGCLRMPFIKEAKKIQINCYKETIGEIFGEATNGEYIHPDTRELVSKVLICNYRRMALIDGDNLKLDYLKTLVESYEDQIEDAEDFQVLKGVVNECIEVVDTNLPVVQEISQLEVCLGNKMINYCEVQNKSAGSLPTFTALASFPLNNGQCSDVKVSEQFISAHRDCLAKAKEENEQVAELPDVPGSSDQCILKNFYKMINRIKKIPELKCTKETFETYNIIINDAIDYDQFAHAVNSFYGFPSAQAKNGVVERIIYCGKKVKDETVQFMKDMKFTNCFINNYASICGLNNALTKEFVYPILNPQMQKLIIEFLVKDDFYNIFLQILSMF